MTQTKISRLLLPGFLILAMSFGCNGQLQTEVLPSHFIGQNMPHGVVATVSDRLAIDSIDGASTEDVTYRFWVVTHAADEYSLTPGKHRLTCSYRKSMFSTVHDLSLETNVKAGYRYVLGVQPAPGTALEWQLVLSMVEPVAGGHGGS
jgi:hypothetical protein